MEKTNKITKEQKKIFFKISSEAHIFKLYYYSNILNTLYINNIEFIKLYHENHDEKLINIFINERGKLKDENFKDELYRFLSNYEIYTNESNMILSHFIIVALYSYYERTLKNILTKTGICSKEESDNFYKYKYLNEFFIERLNFDYKDKNNEQFILIEELRCLNNCIKHTGLVNTYLHKANKKWIIGEEIDNISEDIFRFMDIPSSYLKIIVDKINKYYFNE